MTVGTETNTNSISMEEVMSSIVTDEEVAQLPSLELAKCQALGFEKDKSEVKNEGLFSYGGIDVTFKVLDLSTLPEPKKWIKQKKGLPVVAQVHVKCESRRKGDLEVEVQSPNGITVATFGRNKRRGLFADDADTEIPVYLPDKSVFGTVHPSKSAIFLNELNPRVSYRAKVPFCQAQTKWCLFTFLCFLPTFGLSGIIGFCCMLRVQIVTRIERWENDTKDKQLADCFGDMVDFEGVPDSRGKFALLVLRAFMVIDSATEEPSSGGGVDGSGGDCGGGGE